MKTHSIGFGEAVKTLAAEAGMQPYRFSNFDKKKDFRFLYCFDRNLNKCN